MTTTQNPAAGVLLISVEQANLVEDGLYKLEELTIAIQQILTSDMDHPFSDVAIGAICKELIKNFEGCVNTLEEAGVLGSARAKPTKI